MRYQSEFDPAIVDRVQQIADCCRPTVIKALRGGIIRGRVGFRVKAALEVLGIDVPHKGLNGAAKQEAP